jgi:hypothetical protein
MQLAGLKNARRRINRSSIHPSYSHLKKRTTTLKSILEHDFNTFDNPFSLFRRKTDLRLGASMLRPVLYSAMNRTLYFISPSNLCYNVSNLRSGYSKVKVEISL